MIFFFVLFFLQCHPQAKGLLNESFMHFDDFALIVGKDRATVSDCKTTGEMIEKLDGEVENDEVNLFENDFEDT